MKLPTWVSRLYLFFKSNLKKFISASLALLLILFFPLTKDLFDLGLQKIHFYKTAESRGEALSIITSVIENLVFALIAYTILSGPIDRWLGHDVTETTKFNARRFLRNVSKSNQNIIIQETYIRVLIKNHKDELIKALHSFLRNCVNTSNHDSDLTGRIKILILHPFGEAIQMRYDDLSEYIEEPLHDFLKMTQSLLIEIKEIQDQINTKFKLRPNGQKGDFFQIKMAYEKPTFSLYYCDRYASISYYENVPCENAPQLVFRNKGIKAAAQKHKYLFEKNWEKGILLYKNFFNQGIKERKDIEKFKQVLNSFKVMTASTDIAEINQHLLTISNICTRNSTYASELINYLESNHKKKTINYINIEDTPHFNIFGTGGDNENHRTINISTIVSILASHYRSPLLHIDGLAIIKSGTLAVTGKVGSQTFYETLQSKVFNNTPEFQVVDNDKKEFLSYNPKNGSTFLPITYFGYMYRHVLRTARKEFIQRNKNSIDIYKVIFPLANFTDYKACINGVSNEEYHAIYKEIYQIKQKTGIILTNHFGIDEIFRGVNSITYFQNGRELCTNILNIKVVNDRDKYSKFFAESDSLDHGYEHVERFFQLFDDQNPDITKEIRETISYNIALFIQLNFLVTNEYSSSDNNKIREDLGTERLEGLMNEVYEYFFGAKQDEII